MSRTMSKDQRSPNISTDALSGHPERRWGVDLFGIDLQYHATCTLQVRRVDCFFVSSKVWGRGLIVLKIVIYVLIASIAIVLGLAAAKPDSFQVQRSASMQAPPEKVVGLIDDFHNWGSWSPWEKLDPAMNKTFSGASSGKGSVYAWEGNNKVGAGRMEILDATASQVTIKLDFLKPFETHNVADFTVEPQGGTTQVTWVMRGPSPFVSKIMQVFVSMDGLIGKDFETGLANMKSVAQGSK
jgi:hypothetical protein